MDVPGAHSCPTHQSFFCLTKYRPQPQLRLSNDAGNQLFEVRQDSLVNMGTRVRGQDRPGEMGRAEGGVLASCEGFLCYWFLDQRPEGGKGVCSIGDLTAGAAELGCCAMHKPGCITLLSRARRQSHLITDCIQVG